MCSNRWLCQDSRIQLLEVLNTPTTDVDFWTAFLSGKDGWLQPLKLYATYSGVKQLSGKTKTMWHRSALVEVSCGYQSQPLALCSNSFGLFDFSQAASTARFIDIITKQSFPNLNISIKDRQIGGQSLRFALHNRFWITVGCLLLCRKIRWFQQSRGWLKRSGSSDVCQVSVGPTRASPLHPSLDCRNDRSWLPISRNLKFKCHSIFQWLSIYGNVGCLKLVLLWHDGCSQGGL